MATKTFSSELFLLLWLAAELSNNKEQLLYVRTLSKEINKIIPEIDALTTKYARKLKDMDSGFVLSRGLTYSIALEASLKLQESCYIQMKGYPSSEFYHGPMAMVNDETPVIIYCAKNDGDAEMQKLVREDQLRCIDKVLSLKADKSSFLSLLIARILRYKGEDKAFLINDSSMPKSACKAIRLMREEV